MGAVAESIRPRIMTPVIECKRLPPAVGCSRVTWPQREGQGMLTRGGAAGQVVPAARTRLLVYDPGRQQKAKVAELADAPDLGRAPSIRPHRAGSAGKARRSRGYSRSRR